MTAAKKAQPLLKWPGGKRRVLPEILKYVPQNFNTYYEPFLGGGALFFEITPPKAVINDINKELINVYMVAKTDTVSLVKELKKAKYANTQEAFTKIRALDRDDKKFASLTTVERAARTLYLNRTCFNGLYRVNSSNQFNAPFGRYVNPKILDTPNLNQIEKLFDNKNIQILNSSYMDVLKKIKDSKNFIYLDPPYVPLTSTASFVSYTKDGFTAIDQKTLRDEALKLDKAGNYVLLSNSDTPLIRDLYKDFIIKPIQVKRSIGASTHTRVDVGEVIILGKTLAAYMKE
jgi:DNA adenine methylase